MFALAREAFDALAASEDVAQVRATAFFRTDRDSLILELPSFAAAKRAMCEWPLVADRYGNEADAGDRLTLQFVYQLFPRGGLRGLRQDVRRLWRRYLAELSEPGWVSRGVANLRHLGAGEPLADPLHLEEGVSIRSRSEPALRSLGFNAATLEALSDDAMSSGSGFSQHVICVEHRQEKVPANLIGMDATSITAVLRAVTSLRLASAGDVSTSRMWFTRPARFEMRHSGGTATGGWPTPPSPWAATYMLTHSSARRARRLQIALADLEEHGFAGTPGNLELALRSFNSTYDRFPAQNDSRLVDTMTAAESLLATDTAELTFKLCFRIAGLLGRTGEERIRIFGGMKDFYDARSKVVHGDVLKAKQRRALENVDDARDLVRRLLVAFIGMGASPSATYDRKFFAGQLDTALQDESARRALLRALRIM